MKPWVIPLTCLAVALVLLGAARGVLHVLKGQQQRRTDSYLAIKTHDLDVESFEDHFKENYTIYGNELIDLKMEIHGVFEEHPDGRLFHYNTSEKAWKDLGGRKGYATVIDGRIVWDKALAKS